MVIRNTTQVGNKLIRTRSVIVPPTSKAVKKVIKDIIDSMRHHHLVGMAAPQIGKGMRIFVTEIRKTKFRDSRKDLGPLRIFINPELKSVSKKQTMGWEGCGSVAFANLFGMVKRPTSVVVEAYDPKGKKFKIKAKNLLARIIQHEMDHLNGVVFTDEASVKTYMSRNEYLKLKAKMHKHGRNRG